MRVSMREGSFVVYPFILRLDRRKKIKWKQKKHDDHKSVN